jgi:predicted nucleic-acid-binding protein
VIALDTNVLVRIFTRDDPAQAEAASQLLRQERCWVPKTVLLETEWVLRYTYDLDLITIFDAFSRLLGFRGIEVEDRAALLRALGWYRQGLDFADALHLASSGDAERFATFDRTLSSRASQHCAGAPPVELLRAR